MQRTKGPRRVNRVIPVTLAAVGMSMFAPAGWLASASASILPTTTTVSASPASASVGQSVTLTATVGISGLGGIGITPTGSVTFTTGATTLGTGSLGTCFLTACKATLQTTTLPRGTDPVTATYAGDGVVGGSSGQTTVTVTQVATQSNPYVQTCTAHQPCDTGVVSASDGSSTIDVMATASNGSDTINTYLGGSTLPCTTAGTGQPGNYVVSATDVNKTITYSLFGASADAFHTAHPSATPPHVCYFADLPFGGYYPNNGNWTGTSSDYVLHSQVPYNSSLHGYVGLLPACNSQKSNSPCVVSQTFTTGSPDKVVFVLYEAFRQRCDPHISG
jgi:hypothetical protein